MSGEYAVAHSGGDTMENKLRSTGVGSDVCAAGAKGEVGSSEGSFVTLCLRGGDRGNGGEHDVTPGCEARETKADWGSHHRLVYGEEYGVGGRCDGRGELNDELVVHLNGVWGEERGHECFLLFLGPNGFPLG